MDIIQLNRDLEKPFARIDEIMQRSTNILDKLVVFAQCSTDIPALHKLTNLQNELLALNSLPLIAPL